MQRDAIAKVEVDTHGQLHVIPVSASFPYIYHEAMYVHWDNGRKSLHSSPPREGSYARWFQQILAAAYEQGTSLHISSDTEWLHVEPNLKAELSLVIERSI
jgi:hypothetical protein